MNTELQFNNEWEKRLYDVLFQPKYRSYVECTEFGGITIPLIKLKKQSVYVYGPTEIISGLVLYLKENKIEVKGIIDRDKRKAETKRPDGIPVLHISEISLIPDRQNVFIVISVPNLFGTELSDIITLLHNVGINHFCTLNDRERWIANGENWATLAGPSALSIDYLRGHYKHLKTVINRFKDNASKETLLEWIKGFTQCGTYQEPICRGADKYFFGLPLSGNTECEPLYQHKEDEVWLNCGANIGDSIFLYFANGLDADTIYAVEGDKAVFEHLCRNLERLPDSYREKVTPINVFIDQKTDFNAIFNGKRISLINADIQGSELEFLINCLDLIMHDRPVIAICAYHKIADLIEFTTVLSRLVDGYSYKLRKYPSEDPQNLWELVLYAIPDERNV